MDKKIVQKVMTALLKKKIDTKTEIAIYKWLCIGIVYSMILLTFLNSILIILLAAFWLAFSKKEFDIGILKTKLMLLFILLYMIVVIGLIYTSNINAGLATLKTQSAILFFPLIFGTTSFMSQAFLKPISDHFLIVMAISCTWGLGIGVYSYFQSGNINDITGGNILLFHALRPVTMGLFCLTGIIIALEKLKSFPGHTKLLYAFIFLTSAMVLLLSIRLIIFGWFIILLSYSIIYFDKWIHRFLLIVITAAIIITTGFTVPSVKKQWSELFDTSGQATIILDADSSLNRSWGGKAIRVAIWKCSSDILKQYWLLGVGTGDVQDSLQQAYANRKFYFASAYNRYNAHNQYLQITLATGIPGLIILIACIGYPLLNYRRKFSGRIYSLFLLLFAAVCFTETLLEVNKGIIWYSFFNSIFAFGYLKTDKL